MKFTDNGDEWSEAEDVWIALDEAREHMFDLSCTWYHQDKDIELGKELGDLVQKLNRMIESFNDLREKKKLTGNNKINLQL